VRASPECLDTPTLAHAGPPAPVPWGLGAWLPAGAARRVSTDIPAGRLPAIAAGLLAEAADRSLVIVVRDAQRYPAATGLVRALLAARPDTVVVEMGLPVWRPPAASYLASYGAARASGLAVAQILGLAVP
jgi:beta-N-acetylhexosaminidase